MQAKRRLLDSTVVRPPGEAQVTKNELQYIREDPD